jgi:molybdate transport system substrate-binding protein
MTKTRSRLILFALIFLISSCVSEDTPRINIATAANMQFVMEELTRVFTEQTRVECQVIVSSSGKLTAQVKEGAPFDVFVSADMKYPTELSNSGFSSGRPEIYAYGKLVLWSMDETIIPSVELLKQPEIEHIALANPKTAPYGAASIEFLNHFGIYDDLKDKLVFGESISQTNQFVISGSAQIGFTSKSVVMSSEMRGKGNWIDLDENAYSAIAQGAIILKKDQIKPGVEQFYNFLFSEESEKILVNFGYLIPTK